MIRALFTILLSILSFASAFVVPANAEERPVITLEPAVGTVDDTFRLEITISGKQGGQLGRPRLDPSSDFRITDLGTSTRSEFINGSASFQISFAFSVQPQANLAPGPYFVPGGSIEIEGKKVLLAPSKLTILPSTQPRPQATERSATGLDFTQLVDNEAPYVGEQVIYRAEVASSVGIVRANIGDVTFNGFSRESFGKLQEQTRRLGETMVYSLRDALFPLRDGELEIPSRSLTADIRQALPQKRRSWDMLDDFFSDLDELGGFQTVTRQLEAPAITMNVKPLPEPPKPDLGYIPVGQVTVQFTCEQKEVKQGESINATLELNGDANLKPYELPKPTGTTSADLKVYVDKADVNVSPSRDRLLFRKVFHIAYVPQKAGRITLPRYEVVTFNPQLGKYETTATPLTTVNVVEDRSANALDIRGADAPEMQSGGSDPKNEVSIVGEDLLPLHLGPEALRRSRTIPKPVLLLTLLLFPATFLLVYTGSARARHARENPALLSRQNALKKAEHGLKGASSREGDDALRGIYHTFRTYLGEHFMLTGESVTSNDFGTRVPTLADELRQRTEALLRRFERKIYGGGSPPKEEVEALAREARQVIRELEACE